MCNNTRTLTKVKNGELSICKQCNIYRLQFNNIYLEFTPNEFNHFKDYILTIDIDFWEYKYAKAHVKRKIPIPSTQQNLILMFNRKEIRELQTLFYKPEDITEMNLEISDIDYALILN